MPVQQNINLNQEGISNASIIWKDETYNDVSIADFNRKYYAFITIYADKNYEFKSNFTTNDILST
ncbi:UNVERIFIED_CONTAM: hypothetical protein O8I53_11645 [Campylobacter lari]